MSPSPPASEPRPRLTDLVAAEWIKLRSLRSTTAAALSIPAIAIAVALLQGQRTQGASDTHNALRVAFDSNLWGLLALIAGSIGAMTLTGEYASGLIRTTFTAVPARPRVLAAKTLTVAALTTAIGAVTAAATAIVSQAALPASHSAFGLTDPETLKAIAASTLLLPTSALVGIGIGATIRTTAATIFTVCLLLDLLPALLQDHTNHFLTTLANVLPERAWAALATNQIRLTHPPSAEASWATLAAWGATAVALAAILTTTRDP